MNPNKSYFILLLSLAAYLILKMQRGFSSTEVEGGIWNIIQMLYVLGGLFVLFSKDKTYLSFKFIKYYLHFFMLIWVLSFFVIAFGDFSASNVFHLLTVPYGVMCILPFYYFARKSDIRKYPYILYLAFVVISYIMVTSLGQYYRTANGEEGALADLYYILGLLPIIFIYTPSKYRIIPFLVSCAAVMMSGKRTGFIALISILILYFLPSGKGSKSFIVRLLVLIVIGFTSAILISKLTGMYDLKMFERLYSLDDDGGSGRSDMWMAVLKAIEEEQDVLPLIVGHGYHSSFKLVGGHVHNDFLEFFYDFGIIALIYYICFYYMIIKECIIMYKCKFDYAKEFMVAIIISLFLSMFSWYAVECTHITCCSACIGLILAEWYKFLNPEQNEQIKYQ